MTLRRNGGGGMRARVRGLFAGMLPAAAAMAGRGTSLKAHQLIGAHLKTRRIDFEHVLRRRVARQHADQSGRDSLMCRRLCRLRLEEHRAGSARRDATGVAAQQLAVPCRATPNVQVISTLAASTKEERP